MTYGIDAYFLEHARFRRRLAGFIAGVGIGLLALHGLVVWLGRSPAISAALHQTHILRWGYEGPEQYVRRIELKAEAGASSRNPGAQARYIPASRRGGRRDQPRATHPHAPPEPRPPRDIEGDSEVDRLARARAQMLNVPLVRSEDLIIERLVRPEYPEEARDKGVEGKVAVLALVDTTGAIKQVQVIGASEGGLLERAAEEAVWKCRFQPYRQGGQVQEVYAMFRFAFRIY